MLPCYYLLGEAIVIELVVGANELDKLSHRGKHALSNVVSAKESKYKIPGHRRTYSRKQLSLAYLGNVSISNSTTSYPSRTKTEEARDPAGPPPITSTLHSLGTAMLG